MFDWNQLQQSLGNLVVTFGSKLLAALALYIAGRWLISIAMSLVRRGLTRQNVDSTLAGYIVNIVNVLLNISLVVAILGFFGVETTTFAALLAGAGLAIGTAWGGLLAHFAAGVFMVILRPFKKGDFISAGGVTGTVEEIGLFATTVLTPDNVTTFIGNNKIFGDNISNYSATAFRRVDLVAQLAHSVDPKDAVSRLRAKIEAIPNVAKSPAPDIEIFQFNERGPMLVVRPYTHTDHYWQVYFDTNKAIRDAFTEAGYPVPEAHQVLRSVTA